MQTGEPVSPSPGGEHTCFSIFNIFTPTKVQHTAGSALVLDGRCRAPERYLSRHQDPLLMPSKHTLHNSVVTTRDRCMQRSTCTALWHCGKATQPIRGRFQIFPRRVVFDEATHRHPSNISLIRGRYIIEHRT